METNVTWEKGLTFSAWAESGFETRLDAERALGGNDDGFRPMELMALSLAGCTAMDVISILVKKKQAISAFEVRVQAQRAEEHPRVFTHAILTYTITGQNVNEAAVVRAMELSATKYCPAQAMLGKILPIELRYEIYDEQGKGPDRLTAKGIYHP